MAKCFFTGVESPAQEMFVLDITAARRALRDLHQRVAAVERLIEQLNLKDDVAVYNIKRRQATTVRMFRLVNQRVADVLSSTYPWGKLFITWEEFQARRLACKRLKFTGINSSTDGPSILPDSNDGIVS